MVVGQNKQIQAVSDRQGESMVLFATLAMQAREDLCMQGCVKLCELCIVTV